MRFFLIISLVLSILSISLWYTTKESLKKSIAETEREHSLRKAIWLQTLERDNFTLQAKPEIFNLSLCTKDSRVFYLFDYLAENMDSSELFFYIPINVCSACMDKELSLLLELKTNNQIPYHVNFIVPQIRKRNLQAFLSGKIEDYSMYTYTDNQIDNISLRTIEFIVLFLSNQGEIQNFFAAHKSGSEFARQYYQLITPNHE